MSVVLACIAGTLFAVNIATTRRALDRTGIRTDVAAYTTIATAAVVAILIALLAGVTPSDLTWADTRGFVIIGAIVPGAGQLTFYAAIKLAGPSRVGVIVGTVPMWSVVMAMVFLDESWSVAVAAGTILTVVGGVLVASNTSTTGVVSVLGLALAAFTALLFGIRDVVARSVSQDSSLDSAGAAAVILTVGTLVLFMAALVTAGVRRVVDDSRRSMPAVLVPGVAVGFAMPSLLTAFERSRVGIVSPLNNAAQALAVVALSGWMFGGTEVNRRVIIAVVFVLAGGTVIGVTR